MGEQLFKVFLIFQKANVKKILVYHESGPFVIQVDSFLDDNRLLRRRPIGGHTHRNASHTSCAKVYNKKYF